MRWLIELAIAFGPLLFGGLTVAVPLAVLGVAAHHAYEVHSDGKDSSNYIVSAAIAFLALVIFLVCLDHYQTAKATCDQIAQQRRDEAFYRTLRGQQGVSQADLAWVTHKCDDLWNS